MIGNMSRYKLRDLLSIQNGKDYRNLNHGDIPVYGTGGIIAHVNAFLSDRESILLPRKGTLNNIMYVSGKFWTVDTMYWTKINEDLAYPKYLFYYLSLLDLSARDSGSTLPSMTFESYYTLDIDLPPLEKQKDIADRIFKINQNIENNHSIINNLESLGKTLYDYWFLQFEFPNEEGKPYKSSGGKMVWCEELKREIPEGWKVQTISDITICEDSKRVPLSNKEREEMIGSFPYYGATGIMGYVNRYIFDGDYVLVAEDGSVMDDYFHPIIQRIHGKNWVNNHAHVLSPIKGYHCMFLMLIMKDIYVPSIKTGSIQMKINQENLNKVKICKIPDGLLRKANQIFDTVDACILQRKEEIKNLSSVRDFLLPMLMNGQVTFKD